MPRHAHIEVDPAAITANVATLRALTGDASLCAVVKADGYGHGSVTAARAALAGGASWLAVALAEEGMVLREAGIKAPILLLSEPPPDVMAEAVHADLVPTIYTASGVEAAQACVRASGRSVPWSVHLKVDTGMHRVGSDPDSAVGLATLIDSSPELELGGTFTHLAVADEPDRPETEQQLKTFARVVRAIRERGINPGIIHAANSAGALHWPSARLDMVRTGIAIYGYSPFAAGVLDSGILVPALTLKSEVTMTRRVGAGEGVSYGLRHRLTEGGQLAVVPLGYADGIDRRLGLVGGEVLIGGHRHPIRGVVTMDQLVVEIVPGVEVRPGDEVVLLGRQGNETISAADWAELLGTIPYEILCRFGARVPRQVPSSELSGDGRGAPDELDRLAP